MNSFVRLSLMTANLNFDVERIDNELVTFTMRDISETGEPTRRNTLEVVATVSELVQLKDLIDAYVSKTNTCNEGAKQNE